MKKIIFYLLLLLVINSVSAQEKKDSIVISIDTINVKGFVYDKYEMPISDVKISSENSSTKTNKNGYFELNGFPNKSHLFFSKDSLSGTVFPNDSRFIIYHLVSLPTVNLYGDKIKIEATRITPRLTTKIKVGKNRCLGCFITYETPANYPDGLAKFYNYIQENLKYPEKAVAKNIEGLVAIEFDITKSGASGNFKIIKDIGFDCSTALIELIKKSKKWNPAMSNGKPLIQRFYIEIPFKLTN